MRLSSRTAVISGERWAQFCGYRQCVHQPQCMQKPPSKQQGRRVFFIYKDNKDFDHMQAMKDKIDSPEGRGQYRKRLGCFEPVFGNITVDKQTLRGKDQHSMGDVQLDPQHRKAAKLHSLEEGALQPARISTGTPFSPIS